MTDSSKIYSTPEAEVLLIVFNDSFCSSNEKVNELDGEW